MRCSYRIFTRHSVNFVAFDNGSVTPEVLICLF
jgi:hypothetical protein